MNFMQSRYFRRDNPLMNFVFLTIPQTLLMAVFSSTISGVFTILEENQKSLFYLFLGLAIAYNTAIMVYSVILHLKKRPCPTVFYWVNTAILAVLTYLFTWLLIQTRELLFNEWIYDIVKNYLLFLTFLMPSFIYLFYNIQRAITKPGKIWKNLLGVILIPAGFFFFFMIILPMLKWWNFIGTGFHAVLIFFLAGTFAFYFFFFRTLLIFINKNRQFIARFQWLINLIFCLVLPLGSLLLYNLYFSKFTEFKDVFGDYQDTWFYILCTATGIALTVPRLKNKAMALFHLTLKVTLLPFSLYFFVSFLPFLPLSVLFMSVFGIGGLMLSPVLLMIVHAKSIIDDLKKIDWIKAIGIIPALLVIPCAIMGNFAYHKITLHTALDYISASDFSDTECRVDIPALNSVLNNIDKRDHNYQTPYLSALYQAMVFNNLYLERNKRDLLTAVFLGRPYNGNNENIRPNTNNDRLTVNIKRIDSLSRYSPENGCWISDINLLIENTARFSDEYYGNFELPPGAFISDYYLVIDGVKKSGLLTEKKSALWTYKQITSVRKDPGLLYYEKDGSLTLKIFPVPPKGTRETGFEIIHKEPFNFNFDGTPIKLGGNSQPGSNAVKLNEKVVYLPGSIRESLDEFTREPVYHFIIDCSKSASKMTLNRIDGLLNHFMTNFQVDRSKATVHLANYTYRTFAWNGQWKENWKQMDMEGGFYLSRVQNHIILSHYAEKTCPVMVVLSPKPEKAIISGDINLAAALLPDTNYYYFFYNQKNVFQCKLGQKPVNPAEATVISLPPPEPVIAWPDAVNPRIFLRKGDSSAILSLPGSFPNDVKESTKNQPLLKRWEKAVINHRQWMEMNMYPSGYEEKFLAVYKNSLDNHVLSPVTSFIVVENPAQEKALLAKQEQVLAGKKYMTPMEQPVQMSEPGLLILAVLTILTVFGVKKRMLKNQT
ncbi:MAG: MSEP-CTERM sorting domain-containing protein [Spirochaetales bacterium]|nr:MSEP-CTERM sorting domain-containing protein [Spirochaetales bacterium]